MQATKEGTVRLTRLALVLIALLVVSSSTGFAQDQFFDSHGVRIRYVERGKGDVVILIHGNGGSLQGWVDSGILADLARDYRVVALDVRGHGQSGKPHEPKAYGREMGMDVVRLLDHLGVKQAHIVGYSMGASITAALLTTHPNRFLSATLGGFPGRLRWTEADTARVEKEAAEKERDCVSRTQMTRLAPTNQPPPSDEQFKKLSADCMANPNQDRFAQAALSRSLKDQAITSEQVKAVKVPALGVVGTLDGYLADFQELKKLRPDMKLVTIEGATHGTAMRHPQFLAAVREFLSNQRGSTRR
jgi:pimeloyl-ACP methyl ester carboxylesterase